MQKRKGLIFIALAIMLGLVAAWVAGRFVSESSTKQVLVETTSVVVVRSDVAIASSLSRDQLDMAQWPVNHVPPGAIASVEEAIGRVVRRPLAKGEPVLFSALFDQGASGGLRAVISPKFRAVTVKVDNVIGVAGFVTPGSRVDVMATLRRVDHSNALPYSKVILQNIRVLAVDQNLERISDGAPPEQVSVVTLEVEPSQAERLVYAAHEGRLQLAMRAPGDDQNVVTQSVGVAMVLGDKVVQRRRVEPNAVQVLSGSEVKNKIY